MKYNKIREEELKNSVATDFFGKFDCDKIVGFIDFAVKVKRPSLSMHSNDEYLLWAEAKNKPTNVIAMLTQLVLTIGKARTFDKILPPPFLGCFDCEKIAFVPYSEIQDIFYQNDFNWKVTSSNYETKEFKQIYKAVEKVIENDVPWETYLFDFEKDEKELRRFIRENFIAGKSDTTKIKIDKNNFIIIYSKWLEAIKPTIAINWDIAKKNGIIDGDFYLADLLSENNISLKEKLFVLLKSDFYEIDRKIDELGLFTSRRADFTDNQHAHNRFWAKYERPPREEYWDYIIDHRHLLVPQDVRERKGSFYTPKIWVELSQRYIADVLGDNWQEEYFVWDCAAGTGNLLVGLTNKYNIWASTLDKQDVDVIHDRIENGANLLHDHVFKFDFLNGDFSELPEGLQKIINDPEKRRKLVVYINPPYAEGDNTRGIGRKDVHISKTHDKYQNEIGKASGELFAQFFARIYSEIPTCTLAEFSTLKILQAPNFQDFRNFFRAKLEKFFLVPANTFENVNGEFPIGFFIWNTEKKEKFEYSIADIFDKEGTFLKRKGIYNYDNKKYISDWLGEHSKKISKEYIGDLSSVGNDFQNQNRIFINDLYQKRKQGGRHTFITKENLIVVAIYFAVRKVIPADWINDRDQFLYPNDGWKTDFEFQNNCLTYTLFNTNISSKQGVNHWIPFTEYQVAARDKFDSHFMTDFITGKTKMNNIVSDLFAPYGDNFGSGSYGNDQHPREFSQEAQSVFEAGKKLWQYYQSQANGNVNASLYDIKEYFQGRNGKGKMNAKSNDEKYSELIGNLRDTLQILANKITPEVYKYGFLKN